jgi:hypothetical protein
MSDALKYTVLVTVFWFRTKVIHLLIFFGLRDYALDLARANLQALDRIIDEAKRKGLH